MSTATVAADASTTTGPTFTTTNPTLKSGYIQATGVQIHTAFQTFLNQVNKATKKAINNVGNGTSEANALASLQAYTALEGGNLQAKVQQISGRLPNGVADLFDAYMGPIPQPTPPTSDPSTFVPINQRLQTQIEDMITNLTMAQSTSTLQGFSQNAAPTIVSTFQDSKATLGLFVNLSNQFGNFTVVPGG